MQVLKFGFLAVSLALTGCFDFAANSKFQRDGTAQVDVELAVSMQLAAFAAGVGKNDGSSGDPLKNCQDSYGEGKSAARCSFGEH